MPEAGGLAPLGDDLTPELKALVRELRALFGRLEITVTRYAARIHVDKSVVSRCLSGQRMPRWQFVNDLLIASTLKHDGTVPTREVIGHLRELHRAALRAGNSPTDRILLLEEELADADAGAQHAQRRERELEHELQTARHRIAELEIHARQLEDDADRKREAYNGSLVIYHDEPSAEQAWLWAEIDRLTRELEATHKRYLEAEARCAALEQLLLEVMAMNGLGSYLLALIFLFFLFMRNAAVSEEFRELSPKDVARMLELINPDADSAALAQLDVSDQTLELLLNSTTARIAEELGRLEPQHAADILRRVDSRLSAHTLSRMDPSRAAQIQHWLDAGAA